ncbi:MAG: putative zinc-binding protein [Candidatus Thorarchaeota archaeon]
MSTCPTVETVEEENIANGTIPVLSCEGGCIRGEIARRAANIVAREKNFGRACHGELFTVPYSGISRWMRSADRIVLIDSCFLRYHGRIMENFIQKDRLIEFNPLFHYKKYTDLFDTDSVPEEELK